MLKGGTVVAAGEVDKVLTDDNLSRVFDYPLVLEKNEGRYRAGYAGSADSF
jgi:ABC-type cobalamin/Fe3+-siderophores transport system ATPase subunit